MGRTPYLAPTRAVFLLALLLPLLFLAGPPGGAYLSAGDEATARGDYDQALASYAKAAAVEPWRPAPHFRAGDLALRLGKTAEAQAAYERAVALRPTSAAAWQGLARARAAAGEIPAAAQAFVSYAELRGDPTAAYVAGRLFVEAGALSRAEAALTLATKLATGQNSTPVAVAARLLLAPLVGGDRPAEGERRLAEAREIAGPGLVPRVDAALSLYHASATASDSEHNAVALGRLALASGVPSLAEYHCRRATADVEAHVCLSLALLAQGKNGEALASAERAASLQEGGLLARYARAAARRATGDLRAAIAELKELLAARPADPSFVYELASAYADFGDYAAAARLVGDAVARGGDDPALLLAAVRFHLDHAFRPEEALPWAEKVVKLSEDEAEAWAAYGWALHLVGRHADAVAALERSLEIDPLSPAAHYHLGLAYEKQGMPEKAREQYLQAADLDPVGPEGRKARQALALR